MLRSGQPHIADTKRHLERWTPELGRNPSRKEIIGLLDKVEVECGTRTAHIVKVALSGYYRFLLDNELTLGNPTRTFALVRIRTAANAS